MIVGVIGPLYSSIKIKNCLINIEPKLEIKLYIRERVKDTLEVIQDIVKMNVMS